MTEQSWEKIRNIYIDGDSLEGVLQGEWDEGPDWERHYCHGGCNTQCNKNDGYLRITWSSGHAHSEEMETVLQILSSVATSDSEIEETWEECDKAVIFIWPGGWYTKYYKAPEPPTVEEIKEAEERVLRGKFDFKTSSAGLV
jgi:hypothetical protein